jgi:hypothetical protein
MKCTLNLGIFGVGIPGTDLSASYLHVMNKTHYAAYLSVTDVRKQLSSVGLYGDIVSTITLGNKMNPYGSQCAQNISQPLPVALKTNRGAHRESES